MKLKQAVLAMLPMLPISGLCGAGVQGAEQPWMNRALAPEQRAAAVLREMTQEEKLTLVYGYFGNPLPDKAYLPPSAARAQSAGYVKGVARLGIPDLHETDAGVGVASQRGPKPRERTGLPSGMATAATWNPELAYQGGAMIGAEARASGFNVMLAGGVNLVREARNGRNFEYAGEDPWLAGVMVGAQIRGIQSNKIVSTIKHLATNSQETHRMTLNAVLDEQSARDSDLLAFQFAIEQSSPGSVMCAYNRYNGPYACESDFLMNQVLKRDWRYRGWVMSDWGAVHSTIPAANSGLDQQSGGAFDHSPYFAGALKEAVENGHVPQARLDDMVTRILWALFDKGVVDHPVAEGGAIDFAAHARVTQADAEEGMVLLKNERGLLPLAPGLKRIAVIGGRADLGVLSGGGSSQVYPLGGMAVQGLGPAEFPGPMVYFPSSPLKALKQRSKADISFNDGADPAAAARAAASADVAIVFANHWTAEDLDQPLSLQDKQDALIAAVAAANPNTVVVLQTGGAVLMPWLDKVGAVLEAWYPGTEGGTAIARVLAGEVDASGRLPVTFPASLAQLPHPALPGEGKERGTRIDVHYGEGAAVGYKWFEKQGHKPLFAFGHGLSYGSFAYDDLRAEAKGSGLSVTFTVRNTSQRTASAVPQVYVAPPSGGWEAPRRLGGFAKVALRPGESRRLTVAVDARLLGRYNVADKRWRVAGGQYRVQLAQSAAEVLQQASVRVQSAVLDVRGQPVKQ